jgi:hypothetical protein
MDILEAQYAAPVDWKVSFAALPRTAEYRKTNSAKKTPEIQAIVVRTAGSATVTVNRTGRPMILHLSSSLPVQWRLKVAPGVKLLRVVASAAARPTVLGVPAGVELKIYAADEAKDAIPPLFPPEDRHFGGGSYHDSGPTIYDGPATTNVDLVESRLGAEVTVVQTELGPKNFTIPRRWVQGNK